MKLGIIGCGNMGGGMARHLADSGWQVAAHDPDADRLAALAGVDAFPHARALAAACDVIVLSLPTAAIVRAVMAEIADALTQGATILDTSTSDPATSQALHAECAARGVQFIDGPVSGGPSAARAGSMTMVLGGEAQAIANIRPLLDALTARTVHIGGPGAGHAAKIVNNMLCAANLVLVAEAVRLGQAAGVAPAALLEGVNAGSGRSAVSEGNFPKWVLPDAFDSGFTMGLMRKDVRLAQTLAEGAGVPVPAFTRIAQIWADSAATLPDGDDFNRIVQFQTGQDQ